LLPPSALGLVSQTGKSSAGGVESRMGRLERTKFLKLQAKKIILSQLCLGKWIKTREKRR
jgi:hypothetical protein